MLVRLEDMTTQTHKVQTGEMTAHVKDRGERGDGLVVEAPQL